MIDYFVILILTHFVSDFIFQPGKWGRNKIKIFKYRFFHALQYTSLFIVALFLLNISLYWCFWIFITHLIIDDYRIIEWWNSCVRDREVETPRWMRVVQDQILHILVLVLVAW